MQELVKENVFILVFELVSCDEGIHRTKKQESVNLNMAETCDSVAETQRQTRVSISEYITLFHVSVFVPWSLVRKYMKPGHCKVIVSRFQAKTVTTVALTN